MSVKHKHTAERKRIEEAISEYRPQLHRFLRTKLGNEADIEDIAQESFLRLLRVEMPELIRRPQDYLFRIASNVVHDFYLKKSRDPDFMELDAAIDAGADSDQNKCENELEHRVNYQHIEKLLAELPPIQRAAFLLKKRDGHQHEEIAEKLNISANTSRTYVARVLAHCRINWED